MSAAVMTVHSERPTRFSRRWRDLVLIALGVLALWQYLLPTITAWAQDAGEPAALANASFTFQGRLVRDGVPAEGAYDFEFVLYGQASGGAPVATLPGPLTSVAVANGLFTVNLNFGEAPFAAGAQRWLEVRSRPAGQGAFATFAQRQLITATPYAIYASQGGSGGTTPHSHYGDTWTGSASYHGLTVSNDNTGTGAAAIFGLTNQIFASGVYGEAANGGIGVAGTARSNSAGASVGVLGRVCGSGPGGACIFGEGAGDQEHAGVYGESTLGHGVSGLTRQGGFGSGVYGEYTTTIEVMDNYRAGVHGSSNRTGVIGSGDYRGVYARSSTAVADELFPRAAAVAQNIAGNECTGAGTLANFCLGVHGSAVDSPGGIGVYGQSRIGVYGRSTGAGGWGVYSSGNILTTGMYQTSDARHKTDAADSAGLDEVLALQPRSYRWAAEYRDDGKRHQGFYAQELMEVLPDLVTYVEGPGESGYAVNYVELIPVLVNAIQEQQAQIEELEAQLAGE